MSGEGQVASGRVTEDELLGAAVAAATDQHFDKLSEADAETDETPEVTDTDPEGNEEVEGEGEVEGDEAEGTKDLDEDDEATEDSDEEEEEEDEDLTPRQGDGRFEKRFSKVDPNSLPEELKPIYRSMQSDYTQKTMEAAKLRAEAQEVLNAVKEFEDTLNTPQGLTDLIIQAWQSDPDTFTKAIERIDQLSTEPREREIWEREQQLRQQEIRLKQQQRQIVAGSEQEVLMQTISKIRQMEEDTGLPYDMIEEYVTAKLVTLRGAKGGLPATSADIDRVLDEFRTSLGPRVVRQKPKAKAKKKAKAPTVSGQKKTPSTPPAGKKPEELPTNADDMFEHVFEKAVTEAGMFK